MIPSPCEDLRAALTDVRKAYRLIYLYQLRAFDLARLVSDQFDHEFYAWSPVLAGWPPPKTSDPTRKWAWQMLPSYDFSFLYLPEDTASPRPGAWMLEVNVNADSGCPSVIEQEPDPTKFPAAETCASTVGLYGWACTKAGPADWYKDLWRLLDWPEDEVVDYPDDGIKVAGRRFPLENLPDETSVRNVVEEFRSLCQQHFGPAFRI